MMKGLAIQPPLEETISNLTSASGEASFYSNNNGGMYPPQCFPPSNHPQSQPQPVKKKRNQPGHPDPSSEVIALSPRTLLATNRFVCEICSKGFQRDQNLQLHRRGHNLPWKLKQRTSKEIRKKVYVCPETTCVHHDPSRALGDLTGIKKHFCRKHGEKKWKCEKCSKKYAVQSDWKAHSKICGTKEYRCDCGTLFSRRDSFITHRAFCDALAEESVKAITGNNNNTPFLASQNDSAVSLTSHHINLQQIQSQFNSAHDLTFPIKKEQPNFNLRPEIPPWLSCPPIIGPGPAPQPIDLTGTPSSVFQDFQQNHHHHQILNPNPTVSLGPTTTTTTLPPYHPPTPPQPAAASPYIAATALLQKATQMGSKGTNIQIPSPIGMFIKPHQTHVLAGESEHSTTGIGLNLSSRDAFFNGLASYGNKAAAAVVTGGSTVTDESAGDTAIVPPPPLSPPPPPSLLHDMMMMDTHPLSFNQGPIFEDISFGELLNKKDENFHATHDRFSSSVDNNINNGINEGGGNDNTTRDFLGLRPLSQSEILSITGFRQLHEQ